MNELNFAYWLRGYTEICGEKPSEEQWIIIKDHLELVFKKETPVRNNIPYCSISNAYSKESNSIGDVYLKPSGVSCQEMLNLNLLLVTGIEDFEKYKLSPGMFTNFAPTGHPELKFIPTC